MSKKVVFVGLSGGVDSSVSALRLKKAGYEVVGVFIKVWHPDWLVCNWEAERLDAMRVAAHLGIPFLTCDAEEAYKKDVADYFIKEYTAGRTPNPDVMCNQHVKFGAFLAFARSYGADFIATGHYAQVKEGPDGPELHRGVDTQKDQSYFLWTLSEEQLSQSLFPIGDSHKSTVRTEAAAAGLSTSTKKDSQGICFLGHIDIPDFLSHYIDLQEGPVLNEKGHTIGTHRGAFVYTTGQRHGFSIADGGGTPHYVVSRDVVHNTITVSSTPPVSPKESTILLSECNFVGLPPEPERTYDVQFRYHGKPIPATVTLNGKKEAKLTLISSGEAPSAGQSCVIYEHGGSRCLGGGTIN